MNILVLYNAKQTYTNNVYDHVASFENHSHNTVFYTHVDLAIELNVDFRKFDALIIHYSLRVIFGQISDSLQKRIKLYKGIKCLFIQDEYDYYNRACAAIKYMGIDFVFTCVPKERVREVYPETAFEGTKFISCLTGYVSDFQLQQINDFKPPSQRLVVVGYRGRPLSIRYGEMGQDKIKIGQFFKSYCDQQKITTDISWMEKDRIYGNDWYTFIGHCRGMLGTESGANVFDWDGKLLERIADWRKLNPNSDEMTLYKSLIEENDLHGLMNQISPRVFETIVARTILVLFEGSYSGVIEPGIHYLAVKKDGSNISEVMHLLANSEYVDAMAERAYRDIIASGKYTYEKFVNEFDRALALGKMCVKNSDELVSNQFVSEEYVAPITCSPIRAVIDKQEIHMGCKNLVKRFAIYIWWKLPAYFRELIKPRLKRLMKRRASFCVEYLGLL